MIVMGGGVSNYATVKTVKWQAVNGSLAKRLVIRTFVFAILISLLPLMQLVYHVDPTKPFLSSLENCDSHVGFLGSDSFLGRVLKPFTPIDFPHLRSRICLTNVNLTIDVVEELMGENLLRNDAKALCIGHGSSESAFALREMGFVNVDVVHKHSFFSLKQKQVVYDLEYDDNSFGFVIIRDLNKVFVPALLVNEMERILEPGGLAAVLMGVEGSSHDSLIRSATTVLSLLKSSDVVHVVSLGTVILVAFKKKTNKLASFEKYHLPKNCPSITRNKVLINAMEPLVSEKYPKNSDKRVVYLPSVVDVAKGKFVYIDMGVKKAANFSGSNWFLPSYPIDSKSFSVNIVDHDALVLSSHVKSPGVTFIYHPALADGSGKVKTNHVTDEEPFVGDDEFDFFIWFKETVEISDFVVLKINVGKQEMKFLSELFESGVICHVDELFLHCPESDHSDQGCINVIKSLRNVGVFAHQWWAN